MATASSSSVEYLRDSAWDFVLANGDHTPANVQYVQENGVPVVVDPATHSIDLTGAEVWRLDAAAAETLNIENREGDDTGLTIDLEEECAFQFQDGTLSPRPQAVAFYARHAPDNDNETTVYFLPYPGAGDADLPVYTQLWPGAFSREAAGLLGDPIFEAGMASRQHPEGIDAQACSALQTVVDGLAKNWTNILLARMTNGPRE